MRQNCDEIENKMEIKLKNWSWDNISRKWDEFSIKFKFGETENKIERELRWFCWI